MAEICPTVPRLATRAPTMCRCHGMSPDHRGKLRRPQAHPAFDAVNRRIFPPILTRHPQTTLPMVDRQKEQEANAVLVQAVAKRGRNFAQLARRYSEDPGTE